MCFTLILLEQLQALYALVSKCGLWPRPEWYLFCIAFTLDVRCVVLSSSIHELVSSAVALFSGKDPRHYRIAEKKHAIFVRVAPCPYVHHSPKLLPESEG